ncbi:alpha-2-macroglobulin family protein [Roseococcus sp. SYP-B2431]|uniref:alpha-2-macroglobulin family protein n=1 Tax=Roseococcus sp. SYP-B2431 TaxID=2496640 RepID=UPI00103C3C88|nr:alpha-2-macroglobulin [Roseococcus sp. SYP-B2431]TCH97685.1 alpha-2-macroglobulin family protein [Roseococcus sp. SYP-B2431]
MLRWLFLALLLLAPAAQAFDLPGLSRDSGRYREELERRFPAGGSAQQRQAAETRAGTAERQNNWAAAAQAWEDRAALGEMTAPQWLSLARAQLRRNPPEAARALSAAWQNFLMVPAGPPEIPSLLVVAEALQRMDRPAQQIAALEQVVQRAPDEARYAQALTEARRAAGLLVARVGTEAEAEPARACLAFTLPPARRNDWQPQDWMRAETPVPGLAFQRDGDELCIVGLPHGRTTRILLRAGLPGEDGLRLMRDTAINIAMPSRRPRLAFDSRAFLLARGQEARVPLALMNVTGVKLRVVRLAERNLVPFTRENRLGENISSWTAVDLPESWGRVVWEGALDLPRGEANQLQRVTVPVPPAVREAGPGLYMMVVQPNDGTADAGALAAAQPLILTDLGLTAWRGEGGLAVQARRLGDSRPAGGTRIALMSRNNEILADVEAGADGIARFAPALLRGEGPMAPVALHASLGDDLVSLDLEAASFDLSDRGVSGREHPGPLDAFLWLDRGIYRPGETVQVMALLRNVAGIPSDVPLRLRLRRPNGQVAAETVMRDGGHWPVALPSAAPVGVWKVEALTDPDAPPVGEASLRVDAFVPERLAVEAGPAPGPLVPGRPLSIPVTARFLYGAPGSGLEGSAELRLTTERSPFPSLQGYLFGLEDESFAPDLITADMPETDDQGRATLELNLARAPDTTRPLRGELGISVEEPGGRATRVSLPLAVAGNPRLVGIRGPQAVNANAEAAFELVVADPEGRTLAAELSLRLVRERPDWRIVLRGGQTRYETVWTDEPVDTATVRATADAPARFARSLPFGRYRLEAREANGMAIGSVRFRSGWVASESAEVPDKVDVAADRQSYAPGDTVTLRVTAPFAGRASLAVLTDRLMTLREIDVAEGGTEVPLTADAGWGPGAYVAVTVFRPGAPASAPGRALGLAWVQIDPASRRLDVAIGGPERARPNTRVELPVTVTGGQGPVKLTLAAVDEGILRLTRFASPDPLAHYTGRRTLGADIRDDYGRLIRPDDATQAVLRQGGDDVGDLGALRIPQRNVVLFSGIVETDADGRAIVPLDLPDFAGELRLMAVAWQGPRVGAASRAMTVRDPVLAEALLPRFLAPGDEATLPVLLHNLELPQGEVSATLAAEGAIALGGPARLAARLATGARAQPTTTLRAPGAGEGLLRLAVAGPDGFTATRESRIEVRSSRAIASVSTLTELAPGQEMRLAPDAARFVPGAWRATARLGTPVRFDAEGMLRSLEVYPFTCLEQLSSRALGIGAAISEGSTPQQAVLLQRAVDGILSRQRYDGSFGLWSAQGEPEFWTSAYAAEALIRAKAAGAAVADAALEAALDDLATRLEDTSASEPTELAAQAARLNALSLAGRHRLGAARRLMESLDRLPTPLARAQLGAAFARAGDGERAARAFAAALAAPGRRDWLYDYGSAARDAMALVVLLKEAQAPAPMLQQAMQRLPGPELTPALASTQEAAWAMMAAAALGRDGRPVRATFEGSPATRVLNATAGGVLRNLGDAPLPVVLTVTGTPTEALPAGRNAMTIRRRFLDLQGMALNLDQLRSGTSFLMVIEARAESGQEHLAMISQGLPAGWEIQARLGPGAVPGLPGLGELAEPDATPALDDRVAAAFTFGAQTREFRMAVRLRAVTVGRFELPGAEVSDMYRPSFFARQASGRISILP